MPARELSADQRRTRDRILMRLGIEPSMRERLHAILDMAVSEAKNTSLDGSIGVLDAGCGRKSPLAPFRARIDRLVGTDLSEPDPPPPYLDEFVVADLCGGRTAFAEASFDLILSNFTIEHFRDPPVAIANFFRWLRPAGVVVLTTVNRRHPFVAVYLGMPSTVRNRLQRSIKASAADAHPLVGVCNEPVMIHHALASAGFERVEVETVGHLARAWSRRLPAFAIGAVGDRAAQSNPSRRSTIIATARKPAARHVGS